MIDKIDNIDKILRKQTTIKFAPSMEARFILFDCCEQQGNFLGGVGSKHREHTNFNLRKQQRSAQNLYTIKNSTFPFVTVSSWNISLYRKMVQPIAFKLA